MEKGSKTQKAVQIFAKAPGEMGVNVVKSPVKLTILAMLKDTDMEFDEIVKNTGKSKSTVSVHLKSLREDGIVDYKFDANDHRKKIFFINSKFLGEVKFGDKKELEERTTEFLVKNILEADNFKFSFLLFHTLKSNLIQEGINIDPILNQTGKNIGAALFEKIYDEDINKFADNVCNFWKENGLGQLNINLGNIIEITALECFECSLLPKKGKPACYLDAGIIEALFSNYLNKEVIVTEIKCFTMGDNCCKFLVESAEDKSLNLLKINL